MPLLDTIAKVTNIVLQFPLEKYMKNRHESSEAEYEAMKETLRTSLVPIEKPFPKRDEALTALRQYTVLHQHDDGDLTVQSNNKVFIVTTEGGVFESKEREDVAYPTYQSEEPPEPTEVMEAPQLKPKNQADLVRMEQEGDYCLSCVPSKHLMRGSDALKDAINIFNSKKEFTDVAEEKIQNAVYELNAAEKDLELARVPEELSPAVGEFRNQVRKLRNFLRQDQSGLEVCTILPEKKEELFQALDKAYTVNNILVKYGYDLAKMQLQSRAKQKLQESEHA